MALSTRNYDPMFANIGVGIMVGTADPRNPAISAAQGTLYLWNGGTDTVSRAFINTDGSTTWTPITTSA